MKPTKLLLAVLTFYFINFTNFITNCSAQWQWVNPIPQGNALKTLAAVPGTNTLVAGSNHGTIVSYRTDSAQWNVYTLETNNEINKICFTPNGTGYAFAFGKYVYKTTDKAKTWNLLPAVMHQWVNYYDAFFINDTTAYVVGDRGSIFKTTDGAKTWDTLLFSNDYSDMLRAVYFINQDTGFVAGNISDTAIVLRTQNAGLSWDTVFLETGYSLNDIHFPTEKTGYVIGGYNTPVIRKTTDYGATWDTVTSPAAYYSLFHAVHFTHPDTGFVTGYYGRIYKTVNGASSWTKWEETNATGLNAIFFINKQEGYVAGSGGIILKTNNKGTSWQTITQNTASALYDIHFPDANTGFVVGTNKKVLKTTDQGTTWNDISGNYFNYSPYAVFFLNKDTGFAAGNVGWNFYKTTDGGNSWTEKNISTTVFNIRDILFLNKDTGFAVGGNYNVGGIIKTTDGGNNWTETKTNGDLFQIVFPSKNIGYAAGGNSSYALLFKTSDGGATWDSLTISSNYPLQSLFFFNDSVGLAGNTYGAIYKTTDGGKTWNSIKQEEGWYNWVMSLQFLNDSVGYFCSSYGSIYKTINGGSYWYKQTTNTFNYFNELYFINENTGFAVGEGGAILKTSNGGTICPVAKLNAADTAICTGLTLQLSNTTKGENNQYTWLLEDTLFSNDPTLFSSTFDSAGTFTIQLIADNSGCKDTATQKVNIVKIPSAEFTYMQDSTGKVWYFHTDSLNTTKWEWVLGAGLEDSIASPVADYPYSSNFNVSLTSYNQLGCYAYAYQAVNVIDTLTGIQSFSLADVRITVFPNPVKDKLTLQWEELITTVKVRIVDALGRNRTEEVTIHPKSNQQQLNFSTTGLTKGLYFIYIQEGENSYVKPFVK